MREQEHFFNPEGNETEKPSIDSGVEKKELEPTFSRSHEIKDKNGNLLCTARIEYFGSTPESESGEKEVKGIILEHNGKSIDVLKFIDLKEPIRIFVTSAEDTKYRYHSDKKRAYIPTPDTPVGLAFSLHELGHAKQYQTVFFKKFKRQGDGGVSDDLLTFSWEDDPVEKLEKLKDALPELSIPNISSDTMDAIKSLRIEIATTQSSMNTVVEKLKNTMKAYSEHVDLPEDPDPSVFNWGDSHPRALEKEWQEQKKELEDDQNKLQTEVSVIKDRKAGLLKKFETLSEPIKKLLKIPTKLKERDATRRAFQWMLSIGKQLDTNLINAEIDPDSIGFKNKEKNECSKSTARVMGIIEESRTTTTKDSLLLALGTYDALEKIPVPSLKHLEQDD